MNKLTSFLANDFEDFISFRKKLGYRGKSDNFCSLFKAFDKYLNDNEVGWNDLTPVFFLEFRSQLTLEPQSVNRLISVLRLFFDYMVRIERIPGNPLKDISDLKINAFIPYVFSDEQINQILCDIEIKIRSHKESYFLTDLAVYTAINLIAKCGLRISEAINLKDEHYRYKESTIFIEETKFGKNRLIPVPQSAAILVNNFISVRNAIINKEKYSYIFSSVKGKIKNHNIYKAFYAAVKNLKIDLSQHKFGNITFGKPTPHSLRHSFAVNTLKNAVKKGKNPENVLPVLAEYMGHVDYRYTMLYLKVIDSKHRNGWVDFYIFHKKNNHQEDKDNI